MKFRLIATQNSDLLLRDARCLRYNTRGRDVLGHCPGRPSGEVAQRLSAALLSDRHTARYSGRYRSNVVLATHAKELQKVAGPAQGIEEVPTAPHSPWQNPYCERVIGSIRRECLDHMIVLNERHLHRILTGYFDYYHKSRAHLSLDRNSPTPREVEPPSQGKVVSIPVVGGLHHRYTRRAA